MKKQTLYLIINASLMLVIGIAMSLFISMSVDKDIEDLLFDQNIDLKNQISIESPSGSSYSIIDYKQYGVDEDGKTIGMVYNVKIKNGFYDSRTENDYGYIELLVGIKDEKTASKSNDTMYVQIVTLEQTETYSPKIQAYINEYFQGINYQQIQKIPTYNAAPDADIESGASATTSTNAIKELLIRTFQNYQGIVIDPYIDIFGEGYSFVSDENFTEIGNVTEKQDVLNANNEVIATRYFAEDTNQFGSVEIAISIDADGKIVYAEYTDLNQTMFLSESRSNIETYIDLDIDDLNISADIVSGATYTEETTEALITEIAQIWEGAQD